MTKRSASKGRYNFLIESSVYEDFSLLCQELGLVRSKQIENLLKQFLQEHAEELREIKEGKEEHER